MTLETSDRADLLPGYWVDERTGAWCTIPWPTDQEEKDYLLAHSLGPLVINWAEGRLEDEFGPGLIHPLTGEPWRFTPGQKRFLILFYHYDENGRYVYRSAVKRGSKGTGKDYIAGAHGNIELIGPSQLVQTANGWTGVPHRMPLVQIASNSEAQSKDTLRVAAAMWSREARAAHELDCGETRIIQKGTGGRFEVLTASEASSEGDPASFIILNEALALDTPIPTPSGWTTVAELQVGDFVLSPDGLPAEVTKTTEVFRNRPCYRVTFQDGDSIIADAGHLWVAERTGTPTKIGALMARTTQEMFESGSGFRVPLTEPVKLPEADLPIDPYVLGAWLGDGCRNSLMFTTALDDLPWWLSEFERLGVSVRHLPNRSRPTGEQFTIGGAPHSWAHRGAGYRAKLVDLGIFTDKRIPDEYLRGSIDQRLSLLQGLVDTDGCVDKNGRIIFCNTNKNLADGVAELARSLGHVVHVSCRNDDRKDSYLPVWRVEWMGDANLPSARMPRKRDRLHVPTTRQLAKRWNYIKSIEPVDSVPVKCISVDSPGHLFLAGNWKVTHNSHHMTATNGGHRVAEVARRNVGKSPADIQARLVEYTNAHSMGVDSIAERSYVGWQQQQSGMYKNLKKDILYDSIEADPNLRVTDPDDLSKAVAQAYSDADWADLERLADEVMDPRTSEAEAIRFYLNGLALREDSWVDPRAWDTLARPDTVVEDGERITMFLDCSKSGDATGLVATRVDDGFTFVLGVWQPEKGGRRDAKWLAPRHEVDAAVREAFDRYKVMWFGVDPSPATDDQTEALYWADCIDGWHRDFARKLPLWATPGSSTGHSVKFDMRTSQRGAFERLKMFTEQAERCVQWIDEDSKDNPNPPLTHDGSPALRVHVHNARARRNQWGVGLGKESRDSKKLIDLAVCMVGAHLGRSLVLNSTKIRKAKPRRIVTNW
ncbi:terminase large subunit [Mycobacterium phage Gaia]|uniref:Terminase large subunit n=1 Tax=Mycobacterium phage Gaia TaxID=1486472 RepID=A0A068F1K4_9CAUD|nr:exonuclease [Mycobacterium phage Gaia]AID58822.1 terminase large subunit [Mycobacterium phage Gaia]AYQ99944.1 terminase large subunit [Mycobacterium phage Nebkiss]